MSRQLAAMQQPGPLAHRPIAVIYSPDSQLPRKVPSSVADAWSSRADAGPTQTARKAQVKRLGWDFVFAESADVLLARVTGVLDELHMPYDVPARKEAPTSILTMPRTICNGMGFGQMQASISLTKPAAPFGANVYRIDVARHAGDTFQFHAFYRQLRTGLSELIGWDGMAYASGSGVAAAPPTVHEVAESIDCD